MFILNCPQLLQPPVLLNKPSVGRDTVQEEAEDDDRVHLRDSLQGRQGQRRRGQGLGKELEPSQGNIQRIFLHF